MCNNTIELEIIQGDSFELYLSIADVDYTDIKDIYFTSAELHINTKFELKNGDYILNIPAELTSTLLPVISTDYDITVYFTDNKVKTVKYRGKIKVYEKTNKVVL